MPIAYERDNQRRLITVTVTDPYSVEDILGVIDRQAVEDTWEYAMLYDLRTVTHKSTADLEQMAERAKVAGGGRTRGPVGIAIRALPSEFRASLMYTELTKEFATLEILLTSAQIDAWLARNARGGPSRQP